MRKRYFIVVVAHSVHGRIQRIRVPHFAIHLTLALALFGGIVGVGFVSSYARMLWKISEFNKIRSEKTALQKQYDELRQRVKERDVQLASLGNLASEVSIAFGIKRDSAAEGFSPADGWPSPRYARSLDQFDFLQSVRLPAQGNGAMWAYLENTTPSTWPIPGRISSSFGSRLDPFLGKGSFHTGMDLSAPKGTPVVATADGTIALAGWSGRYGKRVAIHHGGNELSTLYAHLMEMYVSPGQVVRRGEVIGRAGATGRTTASHLHYEVRFRGTPVNPYKYLRNSRRQADAFSFSSFTD